MQVNDTFRTFAQKTSEKTGSAWAFLLAVLAILVWLVTGPVFEFSDTWQLVINTGTTIVTFLMVFLIQNTQNRDAKALHLKLDELIRAHSDARNQMLNLEQLTDEELETLQVQFERLRHHAVREERDGAVDVLEDVHEAVTEEREERAESGPAARAA